MPNVEQELRSRVGAFVAELSVLLRRAALEAVQAQLSGEADAPAAKSAPARRTSPAARPARSAPAAKASTAKEGRPGQKRNPAELTKLVERLAEYIKANPGQRMEQILPALGLSRSELALPMRKLIAAKKVTAKGEKRGTVYTPV